MFKNLFYATLLLVGIATNFAQASLRGSAEVDTLYSKILDEQRELLIHLPNNYKDNTQLTYPVLYLLDGQRNFAHAAGTLDLLNQDNKAQEMIIVAIKNTQRTRDFTPSYDESYNPWGISGGADSFLDFIEQELMPYVNTHYRTQKFNLLSGHSLGGLLAIYALQSRPNLFQAHFAFSPSLWWHDQVIFAQAERFFKHKSKLDNFLFMNMGNEGGQMLSTFERYTALLSEHTPQGFSFKQNLDTTQTHGSTALAGHALAYRHLYTALQPPQAVIDQGMQAVKQFYQNQSRIYGYAIQPSYTALNRLGYQALQQQDLTKAIDIFTNNLSHFAHKADAYDSLAEALEANGQLSQALAMRELVLQKSVIEHVENNAYKTRRDNLLKLLQQPKSPQDQAPLN